MLYPKALLGKIPWEGPQPLLALWTIPDLGAAWSVHVCISPCVWRGVSAGCHSVPDSGTVQLTLSSSIQ